MNEQLRDYADGFDVEKLQSALDWVNARGLGATIYDTRIINGERVRLNIDDERLYGWVIHPNETDVREYDCCLVAGHAGFIHSIDETGYCFTAMRKKG